MKNALSASCVVLLLSCWNICFSQQFPAGFVPQQLIENLDPTDFAIAHDDRMFIAIKSGKILIIENEQLASQIFLDIEDRVDNFNERGLGHIVLDPDFETNHYYYTYYTVKNENHNRVSRFTANGNSTLAGSEVILLNLNTMDGTIHNGGAMGFGVDGKLYVSSGDGGDGSVAQSKTSLLGKILRMNPDGSVPTDNPFSNDATYSGINKLIYALGFRNPFSMDIQPGTGKILVGDVGNSVWEEVNEVQAGRNYGWPGIEGMRNGQTPPANYQDPFYTYNHDNGCCVLGASFYNPEQNQFPSQYVGKFFFADYCGGYIHYLDPVTGLVSDFGTGIDRPLAIRVNHHSGAMYFLQRAGIGGGSSNDNTSTPDGSFWKVTYSGTSEPVISVQPQPNLVSVGEDAAFSISVSGNEPLTYQWLLNGVNISGANSPSYTVVNAQLSDNGKVFQCHVSNAVGEVVSNEATLSVTANTRPIPVITSPVNGILYRAGEIISFAGTASDTENGVLPASKLTWRIDFHHDTHTHPALQQVTGIFSGTYPVSRIGETEDNVWYRIYLTATDNGGLSETIHRDIFPEKTTIQLTTVPSGLKLNMDGQPVETPVTITSVIGITRTLEAPSSQYDDNNLFVYDEWTESELSRAFSFDVPVGGKNYTGKFIAVPIGEGDGLQGSYFNQSRTFNGDANLIRVDETVNFEWANNSPNEAIQIDNFTVRWEGYLLPQFTDTYTFYTMSDDGVRLWINNELIIDQWVAQGPTEWVADYAVSAGNFYPIKIEFFEESGGAVMQFFWKSGLLPKQIVPKGQLFTEEITGTEDPEKLAMLYPTFAKTFITVKRNDPSATQWRIFNIFGQDTLQGNFPDNSTLEIDVAALSPGIYLFKSNSRKGKTIRFVKQ